MIKSYRGRLVHLGKEKIRLETPQGKMGYRIHKLEIINVQPGALDYEHIVQVWKQLPSDQAYYDNVKFDDSNLLGVAYLKGDTAETNSDSSTIIFDNEIFNQDIFITHSDLKDGVQCNYYMELEQIKLNEQEALVAITKNLRTEAQGPIP